MAEPVRLGTELRDEYVYVYGDWFLGELRISTSKLSEYTTGAKYEDPSTEQGIDETTCKSCLSETSNVVILNLTNEELYICKSCRDQLNSVIKDVINENPIELTVNNI